MVFPILASIAASAISSGVGALMSGGGGSGRRVTPMKPADPAPPVERIDVGKAPTPLVPQQMDDSENIQYIFDLLQQNPIRFINESGNTVLSNGNSKSKIPATSIGVLAATLERLVNTFNQMRTVDPMLIEENKGLIEAFETSQRNAVEKNFSLENYRIQEQLKSMGLEKSSVALKLQTGIDREKANAYQQVDMQTQDFAYQAKLKSLDQIGQQFELTDQIYNQINNLNNHRLNTFNSETQARLSESAIYNSNVTNRYSANVNANTARGQANMQAQMQTPDNPVNTVFRTFGANMLGKGLSALSGGFNNAWNNGFRQRSFQTNSQPLNTVTNLGNNNMLLKDFTGKTFHYSYTK